jgi:hypothetical protein
LPFQRSNFTSCTIIKSVIKNPKVERSIKLTVYSEKNQHVNVMLFDENGKEILTSEMEATKGMNQFSITTTSIHKGIYIYRLNLSDNWSSGKIYVN